MVQTGRMGFEKNGNEQGHASPAQHARPLRFSIYLVFIMGAMQTDVMPFCVVVQPRQPHFRHPHHWTALADTVDSWAMHQLMQPHFREFEARHGNPLHLEARHMEMRHPNNRPAHHNTFDGGTRRTPEKLAQIEPRHPFDRPAVQTQGLAGIGDPWGAPEKLAQIEPRHPFDRPAVQTQGLAGIGDPWGASEKLPQIEPRHPFDPLNMQPHGFAGVANMDHSFYSMDIAAQAVTGMGDGW